MKVQLRNMGTFGTPVGVFVVHQRRPLVEDGVCTQHHSQLENSETLFDL